MPLKLYWPLEKERIKAKLYQAFDERGNNKQLYEKDINDYLKKREKEVNEDLESIDSAISSIETDVLINADNIADNVDDIGVNSAAISDNLVLITSNKTSLDNMTELCIVSPKFVNLILDTPDQSGIAYTTRVKSFYRGRPLMRHR